jgi:hypothetical protein
VKRGGGRIWVNVNNPSSPNHEDILEALGEGRGEKKNLGLCKQSFLSTSSIHENILELALCEEGERRRIWVYVNNPSSPTSSIHENILETWKLWVKEGERRIWQCCGSGMFIPDPDFYPSRIPDPKQQQKRGVKKI